MASLSTGATSDNSENVPAYSYCYLIEFAHKHLDFQMAELSSVLGMHGIQINSADCRLIPLPSSDRYNRSENPDLAQRRPFVIISLSPTAIGRMIQKGDKAASSSEEASVAFLLSRCVLVRRVIELWGMGEKFEDCSKHACEWIKTPTGGRSFTSANGAEKTWKLSVHTLGAKYTREEQNEMRAHFSSLDFVGPIRMDDPDNEFLVVREMELNDAGSPLYPRHSHVKREIILENDQRPPLACYFGRIISVRKCFEQYALQKRSYLGPTSMDAELAFLMTNLAHVEKGCMVLDPFVGTGSILLPCAIRGARCVGTDIDIRVLRGRSKSENVFTNFKQFNLPKPELIRSDNSMYHRHFRTENVLLYDAIVCDPPYGIRAGARRTGSKLDNPRPVLEEHRHDHIAQTKPYVVSDIMADLLDVAARSLILGGWLVYIIPSFQEFNVETDLPMHACLEIEHICYQPFTAELGRRMVAMKKVKHYDASQREQYLKSVWKNGAESAEKCANIRERIIEAAKKKPGYEEKAAIRKRKRQAHKEAKRQAKLESQS